MAEPETVADTLVAFRDAAATEYRVEIPRSGHTNWEVRTVAYRWLCRQVADGELQPYGELIWSSTMRLG